MKHDSFMIYIVLRSSQVSSSTKNVTTCLRTIYKCPLVTCNIMRILKDRLTACAVLWIVLSEACFFKGLFHMKVGEPPAVIKEEWEIQERYPRELRNCVCGLEGDDFNIKPWHVPIHVKNRSGTFLRTCTGSLINDRMVVTSHNCLKVEKRSVPPYEGWQPPPLAMAPSILANVDDIIITLNDTFNVGDPAVVKVEELIYNSRFKFSDMLKVVPDEDIAILILEPFWDIELRPPICIPEYNSTLNMSYFKGYYYGVGGEYPDDPTPEYRFVGNLVILPGQDCDRAEYHNKTWSGPDTICVQYRLFSPPYPGGPLVIAQRGTVGQAGFPIDQHAYLAGIASGPTVKMTLTELIVTYFTNIKPMIPYLENYAQKYKAKWCSTPPLRLSPNNRVPKGKRLRKLWPWEQLQSNQGGRKEEMDCSCGLHNLEKFPIIEKLRIAGVEEATPFEYPWIGIAVLQFRKIDENDDLPEETRTCAGTLLNDRMILIAAHCVLNTDIFHTHSEKDFLAYKATFYLRVHNSSEDRITTGWSVKKIYYHYGYVENARQNSPSPDSDIALLVLDDHIRFSNVRDYALVEPKQIRPICIPSRGEWIEPAGRRGVVAGWGKMPDPSNPNGGRDTWIKAHGLQRLDIPIHPLKECAFRSPYPLRNTVLCVGFFKNTTDYYEEDSGGPLIMRQSGYWAQMGIVSYDSHQYYDEYDGNGNLVKSLYLSTTSFYTDVENFLHFIDYYASVEDAKWCHSYIFSDKYDRKFFGPNTTSLG